MNRLAERVSPWLKIRMTGEPSIAQINDTVDKMVYDDGIDSKVQVSIFVKDFKIYNINRIHFGCSAGTGKFQPEGPPFQSKTQQT